MNTDLSVTPTRKSRSREKTKRPDTLDTSEDRGGLLNSGMNLDFPTVHSDGTSLFTQTFPDTAVTFKSNLTPARAKKPKPDLNLGVKPLESTVQKSLTYKPIHDNSKFPRVTATITRPVSTSVMSWDSTAQHTDTPQLDMGGEVSERCEPQSPSAYGPIREHCAGTSISKPGCTTAGCYSTRTRTYVYTTYTGFLTTPKYGPIESKPSYTETS